MPEALYSQLYNCEEPKDVELQLSGGDRDLHRSDGQEPAAWEVVRQDSLMLAALAKAVVPGPCST